MGPVSQTVGANYSVNWTTGGTGPVSVAMTCSGANPVSYALSPSSGGSGSFAASHPGTTNCTAIASSAWGSASASSASLAAVCPVGTVWNGGSCATAATPQSGLNGKVVSVYSHAFSTEYSMLMMVLTGLANSIRVDWADGGSCTLSAPGQRCVNRNVDGTAFEWHEAFRSGGGGVPTYQGWFMGAQLNSDGSLTFVTYRSSLYVHYTYYSSRETQSSIGTLAKPQIDAYGPNAQFQITDWVRVIR